MPTQQYTYYGETISLCEECLSPVKAKIIFEKGGVYLHKYCPTHKHQQTLISTDINYYKKCRASFSPSIKPKNYALTADKGCPSDCGLCEEHEQHTAMGIVEILDECNLKCPTCIAASAPGKGNLRTIQEVNSMLDVLVEHEGEPDLVMISGGEPTIHPNVLEIIELAISKPIKHVMLISNGIRIAQDKDFVENLKKHKERLEIYLQFDSLNASVLKNIRGENLTDTRIQAINNLENAGIHFTLICVVKKNLNENEVSDVIDFALKFKYARGVTFQPCKEIGRSDTFDKYSNYITLSEVRKNILKSSKYFKSKDLAPHPLNPENISIGYLHKNSDSINPVTEHLFRDSNTKSKKNFSQSRKLRSMMYFLPSINTDEYNYSDLFRVTIVSFLDKYNFCTSSVKRSAIHFLTRDKKLIPIDTYYLLYQ